MRSTTFFCRVRIRLTVVIGLAAAGCGFERIAPPLPDAIAEFSLEDLRQIQNDERLTVAERREAIRTAIGAPNNAEGDRLVDFLLNLTVQ